VKIIYKNGDLLTCEEKIIAHGCNAQGIMGAGVAKAIKQNYPLAYKKYRAKYEENGLRLGEIIWADCGDKLIVNAVTQEFYGKQYRVYVSYDAIRRAMSAVNSRMPIEAKWGRAAAMPKIGAGLAGGDWPTIEKIIEEELNDIQPVVYYL